MFFALILLFGPPIGSESVFGSDNPTADKPAETAIAVAPAALPVRLLPATLANFSATTEAKEYQRENLKALVGDSARVFQEYRVLSAASRDYDRIKVELFQTQDQFGAFGLFTFIASADRGDTPGDPGWSLARVDGDVVFWKGNVFARLRDASQKSSRVNIATKESLARALAPMITAPNPGVKSPPLMDSLPAASLVPGTQRYFLGPESLSSVIKRAGEMFQFVGQTEAVTAIYSKDQPASAPLAGVTEKSVDNKKADADSISAPQMKLVIVEYHTPEFATDEMSRITDFVGSLPEAEQKEIVFKRAGNYVVAATGVTDREFAEGLINSIQYPYTVKWLRNPLWPVNDPFRTQKAAQMLLSTFGLLGLILMTVLIVGTVFGATVFLKRRKQQREVFSDAGGMLRLDIEPFVLALPPKRSEE